MWPFIKNILAFSLIVLTFILVNFWWNQDRLEPDLDMEATTLIAGDSHLMTALNPAKFDRGDNICSGAEPYVMTYYKLKEIIRANPQINHILLGFSYHNLSAYQDIKIHGPRAKSQFERYYPMLPMDLPDKVEVSSSKYYHTFLKELGLFPNLKDYNFIEGFRKFEPNLEKSEVEKTIDKHFYTHGEYVGISRYAAAFLDSIQHLTTQHQIDLTLVGAPLHYEYSEKVPEEIKTLYSELKEKYRARGINVLDHQQAAYPDAFFKDHDHLSSKGAEVFTEEILKTLKSSE